jgi:hypothetical protein
MPISSCGARFNRHKLSQPNESFSLDTVHSCLPTRSRGAAVHPNCLVTLQTSETTTGASSELAAYVREAWIGWLAQIRPVEKGGLNA